MAESLRIETVGQAGPAGDDVRGDTWVRLAPADSGLKIEIQSKVADLYGDRIRHDAEATLAAQGVRDARVELRDRGALGFVIRARVEAAAVRAGAPPLRGQAGNSQVASQSAKKS